MYSHQWLCMATADVSATHLVVIKKQELQDEPTKGHHSEIVAL